MISLLTRINSFFFHLLYKWVVTIATETGCWCITGWQDSAGVWTWDDLQPECYSSALWSTSLRSGDTRFRHVTKIYPLVQYPIRIHRLVNLDKNSRWEISNASFVVHKFSREIHTIQDFKTFLVLTLPFPGQASHSYSLHFRPLIPVQSGCRSFCREQHRVHSRHWKGSRSL